MMQLANCFERSVCKSAWRAVTHQTVYCALGQILGCIIIFKCNSLVTSISIVTVLPSSSDVEMRFTD